VRFFDRFTHADEVKPLLQRSRFSPSTSSAPATTTRPGPPRHQCLVPTSARCNLNEIATHCHFSRLCRRARSGAIRSGPPPGGERCWSLVAVQRCLAASRNRLSGVRPSAANGIPQGLTSLWSGNPLGCISISEPSAPLPRGHAGTIQPLLVLHYQVETVVTCTVMLTSQSRMGAAQTCHFQPTAV
jgi:hypothetical protein